MISNGTNTVTSLSGIGNLLVIPTLFEEPPEGAVAWLASEIPNPRKIRKGTIPERIIIAEFEARFYSLLLPRILSGDYEMELLQRFLENDDPAANDIERSDSVHELAFISEMDRLPAKIRWAATAKRYRLLFDTSRPLYIGVTAGLERYTQVLPILTFTGYGQYLVGDPNFYKTFPASSHAAAVRIAQQWFFAQREEEIKAAKKTAKVIKNNVPSIILDLLTAVLQTDSLIVDEMGTRLAWKNGGIHGRFGVAAPRWSYLITGSPRTAIYMMMMGVGEAQNVGIFQPLSLDIHDRVYLYLGFTKEGDDLRFANGQMKPHPEHRGVYGVFIEENSTPTFLISVNDTIEVRRSDSEKPVITVAIPKSFINLSSLDCAAWATWYGINALEKEKRRADKK